METLYAKTNRTIQAAGSTDGPPEGARRATVGDGYSLTGESPHMGLKGGNMQVKARAPEETLMSCPTREKTVRESQ